MTETKSEVTRIIVWERGVNDESEERSDEDYIVSSLRSSLVENQKETVQIFFGNPCHLLSSILFPFLLFSTEADSVAVLSLGTVVTTQLQLADRIQFKPPEFIKIG